MGDVVHIFDERAKDAYWRTRPCDECPGMYIVEYRLPDPGMHLPPHAVEGDEAADRVFADSVGMVVGALGELDAELAARVINACAPSLSAGDIEAMRRLVGGS